MSSSYPEAGGWASAKMLLDVCGHFLPTESTGFADAIGGSELSVYGTKAKSRRPFVASDSEKTSATKGFAGTPGGIRARCAR